MEGIIIILIIFILIILYENNNKDYFSSSKTCNDIDKRCYATVDKFQNSLEASETLAYLNKFSIDLMRYLRQKYLFDNKGSSHHIRMVNNLLTNYNPDNIIENAPTTSENTSYVQDKGEVFAVCLREKASGLNMFHDKNILEYVVMHEMAHLASDVIGHEDIEFWRNFKILMENAVENNMHTPINYKNNPVVYCSLEVNYNPYFDERIITN